MNDHLITQAYVNTIMGSKKESINVNEASTIDTLTNILCGIVSSNNPKDCANLIKDALNKACMKTTPLKYEKILKEF